MEGAAPIGGEIDDVRHVWVFGEDETVAGSLPQADCRVRAPGAADGQQGLRRHVPRARTGFQSG